MKKREVEEERGRGREREEERGRKRERVRKKGGGKEWWRDRVDRGERGEK